MSVRTINEANQLHAIANQLCNKSSGSEWLWGYFAKELETCETLATSIFLAATTQLPEGEERLPPLEVSKTLAQVVVDLNSLDAETNRFLNACDKMNGTMKKTNEIFAAQNPIRPHQQQLRELCTGLAEMATKYKEFSEENK